MEIGVLALLVLITLAVLFAEKTSVGHKFTEWGLKNLIGIDVDELED